MKAVTTFLLLFASINLFAQNKVEITVKGIEKIQGSVLVAVYNTEEAFLKKHIASKKVKVESKEVAFSFDEVASGDYAITLFHDENDNGKLDTNFMGIPNEPYGFSNDASGTFGPPSFDKAKVKVDGNKKLIINLK